TVFQGPKSETVSAAVETDAPFMLIDGAVLTSTPGAQTLRAQGTGTIFASYGRTADVKAWLATVPYNEVSLDPAGNVVTTLVKPTDTASTSDTPAAGDAAAPATAHDPVGSDLWFDEFQQNDLLVAPLQLPATMSVLIAADGTADAPSQVSVSWPLQSTTPWAGPLFVAGGILMAIGVFLYVLGLRHNRRSRGPRRKGLPPLPETQPIDLAVEGAEKGVISSGRPPRRRGLPGRRTLIAVPVVALSAALFTGCTADSWPQIAATETASPSASVIVPDGQQTPAVTRAQAERILTRVAKTVTEADEKKDATLAATRLTGAVLAERTTNYTLRNAIADYAALPAIPSSPLAVVLPQAYDQWPRTVMTVVKDETDSTKPPTIMVLTQNDPWSEYRVSYMASLEASAALPGLAPDYVGAQQVPPDSSFLLMAPNKIAAAYADLLNKGDASTFAADFDSTNDQFRVGVAADRAKRLEAFNQTAASTGSLSFESTAGSQQPVALQTVESGAIVAVNINEIDTVKPTNSDAVIKLDANPAVKALAGVDQSATGFTTTYSDQLFFYVPGLGSTDKIRLLGYGSNLLDAKAIK
ncbi:MAG: glycosyl transferase, partial [Actinobacteria bacterium]|nr:glycosyl transferase [Actinomycetota bacterium]